MYIIFIKSVSVEGLLKFEYKIYTTVMSPGGPLAPGDENVYQVHVYSIESHFTHDVY